VVASLPARFESRQEAVTALGDRGIAPAVAAWMATNLAPDDGSVTWRLDFEAMRALLEDFFRTDLWDVVEQPPPDVDLHFVKAVESDTLTERSCERIELAGRRHGQVSLHRVRGGHWLNTDNPEAVLSLLQGRLPRG
jgi:esterase